MCGGVFLPLFVVLWILGVGQLLVVFETGPQYLALVVLEFTMLIRLALNSFFIPVLPQTYNPPASALQAKITGLCHHVWFGKYGGGT